MSLALAPGKRVQLVNWAFVDYENVGSLEGLIISDYERVFVFCGPKNTRIKVGAVPTEAFCRLELIGVTTTGANNLDFHLAFHLGRFHEVAEKDVTFHIISDDSGFNGLVNHLKKLGRSCKRVATKVMAPKQAVPPPLSEEASLVVARLKQLDGRKRPRKKASFINLDKVPMPRTGDWCASRGRVQRACERGANSGVGVWHRV
jgi:hypothetical protein